MKYSVSAFSLVLAALPIGCGMLAPQAPQGAGGGASAGAPAYAVPKESQELVRKQEIEAYARADEASDEELARLEKEALAAVRISLGKDKWADHSPAPLPASEGVAALRKAKVKMSLEPVATGAGQTNDVFSSSRTKPPINSARSVAKPPKARPPPPTGRR